jgi:hypothetical protein
VYGKRFYARTSVSGGQRGAMQAYIDWEFDLVEQLRNPTHGFFFI